MYELLIPTEAMRDVMAMPNASSSVLRQLALEGGTTTLRDDALRKAAAGICSAEDSLATAGE